MKIFDLDLKKLALLWAPPFKRSPEFIAFLFSFIRPLLDVYNMFLSSRKQNLIRIKFNYQVCSLEYRLNDAFDSIERRIMIVDSEQFDDVFLYTKAEDDQYHSKTKWLYGDENPIFLRTHAELYTEYDFIVQIPDTNINIFQLKAEIDFYKLPTKRYKIEII